MAKPSELGRMRMSVIESVVLALTVPMQLCNIGGVVLIFIAQLHDYNWNDVLSGSAKIPEENPGHFFYNKTFDLDEKYWAHEKTLLKRGITGPIVYTIILLTTIIVVIIHQIHGFCCDCQANGENGLRRYRIMVIIVYIVLEFLLQVGIAFQSTSTAEINDNQLEVHAKLFHVIKDSSPEKKQNQSEIVIITRDILSVCLKYSMFQKLNPSANFVEELRNVTIIESSSENRTEYLTASQLETIGFCQYDAFKGVSVILAMTSSLISLIIPFFIAIESSFEDVKIRIEAKKIPEAGEGQTSGDQISTPGTVSDDSNVSGT